MTDSTRPRGRPPLTWLTPGQLEDVVTGSALVVELHGRHTARTIGRLLGQSTAAVTLRTTHGQVTLLRIHIKRARPVPGLFEPGDPVLLRDVPQADWRGGVVRTQGTEVLVETLGGDFAWHSEVDLEPPEARDVPAPSLARGPVPARG